MLSIYDIGIIGSIIYILWIVGYAYIYARKRKELYSYAFINVFVFILNLYQRPSIFNPGYLLIPLAGIFMMYEKNKVESSSTETCKPYKISVIVATYNSSINDLKTTIVSILKQRNVDTEIIVVDDGSADNNFDFLKRIFDEFCYHKYKLLPSNQNLGTCKNVYRGIKEASYSYIKLISPGDFFFDEFVLYKWLDFVTKMKAELSFSNALYYKIQDNCFIPLKRCHNPSFLYVYNEKDFISLKLQRQAFLLLPDAPLGAALLVKKEIILKYLAYIVGNVKYCEDYFIKLYLLDGGKLEYFQENGIWYKYGEGVSTNNKWKNLIIADKKACALCILDYVKNNKKIGWQWKAIFKYQSIYGDLPRWRYILFPQVLFMQVIKKIKPRLTSDQVNISNIEEEINNASN